MAMKSGSPWWISALFAAGLVCVFLGERPLASTELRWLFTGIGLLLLVSTTMLRVAIWVRSSGATRKVEKLLLLCHAGVWVALLGYLLTTEWGRGLVGVDAADVKGLARWQVPMTVLWALVMLVSVVPLLMIEVIGIRNKGTTLVRLFAMVVGGRTVERLVREEEEEEIARHGRPTAAADAPDEAVELFRVREMATSGLTIALALGFLMVTCNVANQRNIRRDVSYFKTSSPGTSTVNAVKAQSQGLKVVLFFPPVNEVKDEVQGYFEALAAAAGNVAIETHDHRVVPELAKKYKVTKEGTIVLVQAAEGDGEEKFESLTVEADPEKAKSVRARTQLRELDRKVNAALLKVIRERRTAYFTVGHGEINDPDADLVKALGPQTREIRKQLTDLNYLAKDLSLAQGLGNAIPDDADLLIVLAPQVPLLDEEIGAIDSYLARGGKLLIALDPQGEATLGTLAGRLGVRFNPTPITDDKEHILQSRTVADRRLIITNRFSSHASITTLTRGQARKGILFINAGSLDEAPFTTASKPKRTFVLKSMPTSFRDEVDPAIGKPNFKFDEGSEKRQQYNMVAVVEGPPEIAPDDGAAGGEDGEGGDEANKGKNTEMRVMVVADAEIFADQVQVRVPATGELFTDAVKWLGGEEYIAGEIVSEKDVYIEHTKSEDALWFYLMIVGAPVVVLGFGLWFSSRRRRTRPAVAKSNAGADSNERRSS